MKKTKKAMLLLAISLPILAIGTLSSCENLKRAGGNEMIEGSRTYNYAYVKSQVTGDRYYHISGWKEYGPEGGVAENGTVAPYVGLELQLATSKDVVYYYEPNLMYLLTKNYDSSFGKAID